MLLKTKHFEACPGIFQFNVMHISFVQVRDVLISKLALENGRRESEFSELRMDELAQMNVFDGGYAAVSVQKHKTASKPCIIVLSPTTLPYILNYVQGIRHFEGI